MSKSQEFEKAAKIRDKVSYLENVFQNAHVIENIPKREGDWAGAEKKLRRIFRIKNKITRIEGYDISNIQGELSTGSMVVFENGKPDKKEYKRFRIKTVKGANDVAMLKEVLERRLSHPDWKKPQIILIDGGKAQLNIAIKCLTSDFKRVRVMALAKRKNELFIGSKNKPVLLKSLPQEISNLILQIRDEAHGFAISYHKKLRSKDFLKN